ncbi:MAG TPA: bifunctional DNA primase/polymerase [Acidimicrobiales bacterium]|nr:bifunctional DNA primase/polymerase [Acidimicrobiales bacterium]
MKSDDELLAAALAYARRGWAVFPCHSPAPKGGCSCCRPDCSSPAKHPRIAGGLKAATTDEAAIRAWWRRWPQANVAVRTGAASELVVLDVDPGHGGDESVKALVAEHGRFPPGPVVATGGAGRHLYLAHPGAPVRNDAGRRLGPGIDLRGDGGYVIAPPSRHASGGGYEWERLGEELPPVPAWLAIRLAPPERPRSAAPPIRHEGSSPWAYAALRHELGSVAGAAEGCRNHTLNRAAFKLGQLVAGVSSTPKRWKWRYLPPRPPPAWASGRPQRPWRLACAPGCTFPALGRASGEESKQPEPHGETGALSRARKKYHRAHATVLGIYRSSPPGGSIGTTRPWVFAGRVGLRARRITPVRRAGSGR